MQNVQFEKELLAKFYELFRENGAPCELKEETESSPFMLRLVVEDVGELSAQILCEMCFINLGEEGEDDKHILQMFSTIAQNVPPSTDLELRLMQANLTCLLGAYGVYRPAGHIYHKYNIPIVGNEIEDAYDYLDEVTGFLLSMLEAQYDAILEMAL